MVGAKVVSNNIYDSVNEPMLNQLSNTQINAAKNNPDLRKKLRVDRVRRMAHGENDAGNSATLDDPQQPDWMKVKSLREIEFIRESKKRDILSQVIGAEMQTTCPIINVVPG